MQQKKQEKRQSEKPQGDPTPAGGVSRRSVLKNTTALTAAATFAAMGSNFAWAQVSEEIKVGVIGAGGRASGAVRDHTEAVQAAGLKSKIVAVCDMFPKAAKTLADKYKVPADKTFSGLDGYKEVIGSDVEMIITATPPGFRPIHFAAAIEAGKHCFFEKPVAVDPAGVRKVIAAGKLAKEKNIAAVTGTQRRHQVNYNDGIKAIRNGDIGDIVHMSVFWNGSGIWWRKREPGMTDMEYQIHNWYHHIWLCGDQIVEQHIHNIDVANWVMDAHPVSAMAVGGRQVRKEEGEIWDHFCVDYEYPSGGHVLAMCRHWPNSDNPVMELAVGSKGTALFNDRRDVEIRAQGGGLKKYKDQQRSGYVQEHIDMLNSIKDGKPLNEAQRIAESTLTAIIGRMSAYTGKKVSFDWALNESKLDLMPKELTRDAAPPPIEVPEPGKTKLI
jgi:myo-inositol 2-dehydrogenase/D-chiro-inositol 1-dehydrogenase